MAKQLEKVYDPKQVEDRTYQFWLDKNYFHADAESKKEPYTIVIPPPNITGQLHMGHALDNTLQDALIRWRRMQGYEALWLPGTDHASIATEAKIVEAMRKEGVTKEEIGREGFLERAWEWRRQYGGRIVSQLKKLGSSCDWERERFTLDEGCSRAVQLVFQRLYDQGLIYRGNRMVNWCPTCNTSISDAEVEYEEQDGSFWHLLYTVKETGEQLELATTRPETMLGDTAVAINGEDPRYAHLHGCHVILPLLNKEIPIVCDEHADMEKGTGVVKITPAHDPNDFEVGERHNLPRVRVFTYDGRMTGAADKAAADELFRTGKAAAGEPEVLDCGKYAGMTTREARKAILEDLEACGALKSVEPLRHDVGTCYRCHCTIEPMVSKQWFVSMKSLAEPAIKVVRDKEIRFVPERFDKNYFHWMENIRDWCISRQLWWGHRIPAYYCDDCGETVVTIQGIEKCPKCGGHMTQDPDTLDTWFSSALWPFSTLGWPDDTPEMRKFYPTSTLVTGYDIITFWVSRMIFSGLEYTGKKPFDTVLIHGLVRDAQGRKMSKSLGNGVDPLEVIDQYGADALRFTLATGNSPGNDMRFSDERVQASRNFCNKIWNASRFIQMNLTIDKDKAVQLPADLALEDKWIVSKFNTLVADVTRNIDQYELGLAASKLNDFIWENFCDWYIEIAKTRLQTGDENVQKVLCYVLSGAMQLLHPFMPFITETIWQALPHEGPSVMVSSWPEYDEKLNFSVEEAQMESLMDAVRAIRNRRAEMNVPPSKKAKVLILTEKKDTFSAGAGFFPKLAYASEIELIDAVPADAAKMASVVTGDAQIYMPMGDLIDFEAERARLGKEKSKVEADIDFVMKKLNNPKFVDKAPEKVVAAEREKADKLREHLAKLEESIAALG